MGNMRSKGGKTEKLRVAFQPRDWSTEGQSLDNGVPAKKLLVTTLNPL